MFLFFQVTHLIEKIYNMENIGPTHHQISELLIDERISDMTQYLMEDYDYTLEQALDDVYSSKTIKWLQIEEAELYVQSSAYIYEILINELGLYPVFDKKSAEISRK